ncbi:hypothetical protein [uncultured Shewanella sp.]|uniref:hypothetical protein n=1 Tax=uncultured Shewanella sp. TaxID=173975 RepID=UPI002635A7A8|nr:hypothetical protein [uncultured Shewanella sp.]
MKILTLLSVLSVMTLMSSSIISAQAENVERYSISQRDSSRTEQTDSHYQFNDNPAQSGAIIHTVDVDSAHSQHDSSQTYAVPFTYDFANNPGVESQWRYGQSHEFKQTQHDKSMSEC